MVRDLADLQPRIARLAKLALGFAREVLTIHEGDDPLLYEERRAYLAAIHLAIAGLEAARVALARARMRLEESPE